MRALAGVVSANALLNPKTSLVEINLMNRIITRVIALTTASLGVHLVSASEPEVLVWRDLLPAKVVEDPFEKLSDQQLQELSDVVRVRTLLAQEKISPKASDVKDAAKTEQDLKKQGVDIEWLLSQRDRVRQLRAQQANTVEPSLDGKHITLAGYVIPVRTTKGRLTEFLLLSSVDACSHATLPPPNQIVYVQLRDGIANVDRVKPVLVSGSIKTQSTTKKLLRGNGPTDITAAYAISADTMKVYSAPR